MRNVVKGLGARIRCRQDAGMGCSEVGRDKDLNGSHSHQTFITYLLRWAPCGLSQKGGDRQSWDGGGYSDFPSWHGGSHWRSLATQKPFSFCFTHGIELKSHACVGQMFIFTLRQVLISYQTGSKSTLSLPRSSVWLGLPAFG